MARALRRVGFDVLSVANNHAFDHGPDVLKETIFHCEQAGIKVCGLRGNSEYYSEPVIIHKNSLTIGILAYNWVGLENAGAMGHYIAIVEDSIVNYTWNRNNSGNREARLSISEKNKNVIQDIIKLRKKVDILVLMPHWGYEWTIYPPYGVILEGRSFIDAGVDLIIGCHSHVAQGMERYKNGFLAYSLGNFLFDSATDTFRYGMIFDCTVEPGKIKNHKITFIKRGHNFRIEPVSKAEMEGNELLIEKSSEVILSNTAERDLDDELIYQEYERQYNIFLKICCIIPPS
jgi:poly-gamma-glutamate synthesis protein (capsule biosynthesis protein)